MKYLISTVLLFLICYKGYAQSSKLPDPKLKFTPIIVTNLNTSVTWYADKLGYTVLDRIENEEFGFSISNFDQWIAFLKESGVEFHGKVVSDTLTG